MSRNHAACLAATVPSAPRVMVNVASATPATMRISPSILTRKFPVAGNAVASVTVQLVAVVVVIAADSVKIKDVLLLVGQAQSHSAPGGLTRSDHLSQLRRLAGSDLERHWLDCLEAHNLRLPSHAQRGSIEPALSSAT